MANLVKYIRFPIRNNVLNKIKEIFDPKLGAKITHSQKILISDQISRISDLGPQISDHRSQIRDHRSQISDHMSHILDLITQISDQGSQITNLRLHKSGKNLMILRSLEKSFKPLPSSPFQKDQSAFSELVLSTELKIEQNPTLVISTPCSILWVP